jgi:hypothetical protein
MRTNATRDRQRERNVSRKLWRAKLYGRSRVSNGNELSPAIDGRSCYGRRLRDLIGLHVSDLGGVSNISAGEGSLIRRVACITVELEHLEGRFARAEGGATPEELQLYCGASSVLNRLLTSLGLRRRPKDVTPTLRQQLIEETQRG